MAQADFINCELGVVDVAFDCQPLSAFSSVQRTLRDSIQTGREWVSWILEKLRLETVNIYIYGYIVS